MTSQHLRVERPSDGVALLVLDNPDQRNAMSDEMTASWVAAIDDLAGDPSVRAVVVTGEGTAFCSGGNTSWIASEPDASVDYLRTRMIAFYRAWLSIRRLEVPTIAAVNGHAIGAGLCLALACDLRYAAESASFGAVFIKRGVSACDMGTSYHLPRLVGASRSAELLLTGRTFDATEARDMGLVLDVVPDGEVVARALVTARQIAENGPLAVWMTKETMWQTVDSPSLRHALDLENRTQIMCTGTGELAEAFAAFREGRTPMWGPL